MNQTNLKTLFFWRFQYSKLLLTNQAWKILSKELLFISNGVQEPELWSALCSQSLSFSHFQSEMLSVHPDACLYQAIGQRVGEDYVIVREDYVIVREDYIFVREDYSVVREDYIVVREDYMFVQEDYAIVREDYLIVREDYVIVCEYYIIFREDYIIIVREDYIIVR